MTNTFRLWQLLSAIIAGMLNEQQQQIIEYLKEENRILRAQIGNRVGCKTRLMLRFGGMTAAALRADLGRPGLKCYRESWPLPAP